MNEIYIINQVAEIKKTIKIHGLDDVIAHGVCVVCGALGWGKYCGLTFCGREHQDRIFDRVLEVPG